MRVINLLKENEKEILAKSFKAIQRTHLTHYEKASQEETEKKLQELFNIISKCIQEKNLNKIISYANKIAGERFHSGFDLFEVQVVFNVLEETMWKLILEKQQPYEFAESLGLISTVLGAGKDELARTYVSLASETKVTSLDLKSMF